MKKKISYFYNMVNLRTLPENIPIKALPIIINKKLFAYLAAPRQTAAANDIKLFIIRPPLLFTKQPNKKLIFVQYNPNNLPAKFTNKCTNQQGSQHSRKCKYSYSNGIHIVSI